ncbi:putative Protease [Candidatus Terasakiella magnetica]|uniref:Ubiquinone biosynthesis protein UbiV n=1 Tax=Candidatus Terasakiella magnetica TaxID=1867952 RepID=A0A1C3RK53_9PROT|nr:U32 family peptidase [Candidatus Terasakiella magnetica]SCA57603.1 putative Protease [Candidatus Terasakiella magnetica]
MNTHLNLGPVLFNWPVEKLKDFYFAIADEAPVDTVFLGEVVCSKRQPFFAPEIPEVAERLTQAGKRVIFSTLALVMTKREMELVRELCDMDGVMIEANDISACSKLMGRPHAVGPFVNVYNEGALGVMEQQGATHISLPSELSRNSLQAMAKVAKSDLEVQIFGRLPLALSARCYHARSHGLAKDSCQYVCDKDPDGMDLDTLDGDPFLAVNGIQTMSYTCANLVGELDDLQSMGIRHFRLSPHDTNMADVASIYRDVLDGKLEALEATERLDDLMDGLPFANGFYYQSEGVKAKGTQEEFDL